VGKGKTSPSDEKGKGPWQQTAGSRTINPLCSLYHGKVFTRNLRVNCPGKGSLLLLTSFSGSLLKGTERLAL